MIPNNYDYLLNNNTSSLENDELFNVYTSKDDIKLEDTSLLPTYIEAENNENKTTAIDFNEEKLEENKEDDSIIENEEESKVYEDSIKDAGIKIIIEEIDDVNDNNNVYEKAQMLHTIDAFEALTSDRPYHRGLPSKEALKILAREGKYEQRTLEYITEVSSKDEIGTSAIHRNGFENNPDFINQLIMGMSL